MCVCIYIYIDTRTSRSCHLVKLSIDDIKPPEANSHATCQNVCVEQLGSSNNNDNSNNNSNNNSYNSNTNSNE